MVEEQIPQDVEKKITGRNDLTRSSRPAIIETVNSPYLYTSTNKEPCQVSDEEFFIDAGRGRTIVWDTHRHRMVMTRHRDHLASQAHEASRHGLGQVRSRRLRAWYTALATEQDDQNAADMLTYFDALDAELEAIAPMSHDDMVTEAEEQTADPHSGAPPGEAREVRPHHVATMVRANRRTKEAGCHASSLLTHTSPAQ